MAAQFYLTTIVEKINLNKFQQDKDVSLLKFVPIFTDEPLDAITQEMEKRGFILLNIELEELLEHKINLIKDFKKDLPTSE